MIKPLTSLRFFFALCVFFSHLSFLKTDHQYKYFFINIFSEGFFGVSFFFILSGFILALNYQEKFKNNTISLKKFYVARFARIYPLHFVTMLVSLPIAYNGLKTMLLNSFLFQSYIPLQKYYFSLNSPSWSISNEMFFYLFFPLLIGLNYKLNAFFKMVITICVILILILLNIFLPSDKIHYWIYISPFTRIFDFLFGIFLFDVCLYLKNSNFSIKKYIYTSFEFASVVIFFLFFIFKDSVNISYRYSIYYWFPMCLILLSSAISLISENHKSIFTKLLSWRPLVYLGEISFAFYLLHQLVIRFFEKYGLISDTLNNAYYVVLIFVLTLTLSIFAYEKIEKPLNKKIKHFFA